MRSIVSAFCAVFDDCSLWSGFLLDWMLVGTRHAQGPVSEERFSAQWRDPVVAGRLHEAGLDEPAQLGATFLADAPALRELVAGEPALDDDHPYRISPRVSPIDQGPFIPLMQIAQPAQRFFASELVHRLWPASVREATRAAFLAQDAVNAAALGAHPPAGSGLADLDRLLTRTTLHAPVLWALGTSVAEVRLAQAAVARGRGLTDGGGDPRHGCARAPRLRRRPSGGSGSRSPTRRTPPGFGCGGCSACASAAMPRDRPGCSRALAVSRATRTTRRPGGGWPSDAPSPEAARP